MLVWIFCATKKIKKFLHLIFLSLKVSFTSQFLTWMRHLNTHIAELFFRFLTNLEDTLKKTENLENLHFLWYKSISIVTGIFHHSLIETFLKYSIFFRECEYNLTNSNDRDSFLYYIFRVIELIKNAVRERINILLHCINKKKNYYFINIAEWLHTYKQHFKLQCSLFFDNSYFKISKILKII